VLFVLSGVAAAIQELYERAFDPRGTSHSIWWLAISVVFKLTCTARSHRATQYGALGVMLSLMSFLIAVGVVIIPGAIIGVVWRLRRTITPDGGSADQSN
jgi:uncharacterized BrkB/YihY/UPF0761 family membrane protein